MLLHEDRQNITMTPDEALELISFLTDALRTKAREKRNSTCTQSMPMWEKRDSKTLLSNIRIWIDDKGKVDSQYF